MKDTGKLDQRRKSKIVLNSKLQPNLSQITWLFVLFISSLAACSGEERNVSETTERSSNGSESIETLQVKDNVYMLQGGGGNTVVLVGGNELLVVDTKRPEVSQQLEASVAQLSDAPVRYIINTHIHGDHHGGNEGLAGDDTVIIANERLRERLLHTAKAERSLLLPQLLQKAKSQMTIHIGGEQVIVRSVSAAHTDTDTVVYLSKANVLATGDNFRWQAFPNIDLANGGDIDGLLQVINSVLSITDENTLIVPGHGPLSNRSELIQFRDVTETVRNRVKEAIEEGLSEDEAVTSGLTDEFNKLWEDPPRRSAEAIIRMYYQSLEN